LNRPRRLAVVVPMLIAVGWAGCIAFDTGKIGAIVREGSGEIEEWTSASKRPPPESLAGLRSRLAWASQQSPRDPVANELIGITEVQLHVDSGGDIEAAKEHFARALTFRPTSPYTWANLAEVMYRMGDTGPQFSTAIREAARMGPFEPEVQRAVAFYGLAVWDQIGPEVQSSIDGMVAAGMRRNPLEMLRIAQRRGRLNVACSYSANLLSGAMQPTDSKLIHLCQSVEATP
jgi:tetratricopeptide (TPR) repeat protein